MSLSFIQTTSAFVITLLALATPNCATAQSAAVLSGAGYSEAAPPEVAPGQVTTLFFHGIPAAGQTLRSANAAGVPLPVMLAGIALHISQGKASYAVPLFSVRQNNECAGQSATPDCLNTAIRVQIPYELSLAPADAAAQLLLEVDGRPSRPFPVRPAVSNAHVLTSCDAAWDTGYSSTCNRSAFHGDGRPVDASAPALPGETVIVYAYGLGPVFPDQASGTASTLAEIPQSGVLRVWAEFRNTLLNASPSVPRYFDSDAINTPGAALQFAGLTPGQVGMYQLNLRVPQPFPVALPCGPEIHANAIALITTFRGTENVPLCVQP